MHIGEMHVMFRQFAQQMGIQNYRAILPEQIDLVINTSINDTWNQLVASSVALSNDRIITDNSKIMQINSLRTLYKVKEIKCIQSKSSYNLFDEYAYVPLKESILIIFLNDKCYYTYYCDSSKVTIDSFNKIINNILIDFPELTIRVTDEIESENQYSIEVKGDNGNPIYQYYIDCLEPKNVNEIDVEDKDSIINYAKSHVTLNYDKIEFPFKFSKRNAINGKFESVDDPNHEFFPDYGFLVDFDIIYKKVDKGFDDNGFGTKYSEDSFETNNYPVRLIDNAFLADTLNDFLLKPNLRSPVIVATNNKYTIYLGRFINTNSKNNKGWTLANNLLPYIIRMSYIAKPAKVQYNDDLEVESVDCDLPENLHVDIVKHAVDLYRIAITGALYGQQQQQNRETSQQPQQSQDNQNS